MKKLRIVKLKVKILSLFLLICGISLFVTACTKSVSKTIKKQQMAVVRTAWYGNVQYYIKVIGRG